MIRVWDTATEELVTSLAGHSSMVRDLAFAPDNTLLLSTGWDQTVRCWPIDPPA